MAAEWIVLWDRAEGVLAAGPRDAVLSAVAEAAGGAYDGTTLTLPGGGGAGLTVEGAQDVFGDMVVAAGGSYDDVAASVSFPPATAPDATTTGKGVIQLAGMLGGTAALPTVRAASATLTGAVELATTAETTAGTDTVRATTPAGVKAVADLLVPKSLVDAKGDLLVASGADVVARVGVGTNGQVLTADSAQAGGVKWATPAAGGGGGTAIAPCPGPPIGRTLTPAWRSYGSGGGIVVPAGTAIFIPFLIGENMNVDRLIAVVDTAGGAGSVARFGMYTLSGGAPKSLLYQSGTFAGDLGDKMVGVSPSWALSPGWVLLALVHNDSAGTLKWRSTNSDSFALHNIFGYQDGTGNVSDPMMWMKTPGYDAVAGFPATATVSSPSFTSWDAPWAAMRRSA